MFKIQKTMEISDLIYNNMEKIPWKCAITPIADREYNFSVACL